MNAVPRADYRLGLSKGAFDWILGEGSDLTHDDGSLNVTRIAADAGIPQPTLDKVVKQERRPDAQTLGALVAYGARRNACDVADAMAKVLCLTKQYSQVITELEAA